MSLFLKKHVVAVLGLALWSASWKVAPAQAADRFYQDLLRSGTASAESGDPERAVELLRVACFGLLEEPTVLAGCLVRLALVQVDLDDAQAFASTFDRILEVENGFAGYSDAALPTLVRTRFESHLREWVKPEDLIRSSTFRQFAEPEELEVDPSLDEAEVTSTTSTADTTGTTGTTDTTDEESVAENMAPSDPVSIPPREVTEALDAARNIQRDGDREAFTRELARLRSLAERFPEITDLHHMAGVLAYRLGLWPESREFFERGGEVDEHQSAMLFYFAVVLYKTDALERAAEVLERSLPTLRRSPFVDEYVEKILGPGR